MSKQEDLKGRDPSIQGGKDAINAILRELDEMPEYTTPEYLRQRLTELYEKVLAVEREAAAKKTKEFGYETLTTDTYGFRTAQWFKDTGLAFSAGYATTNIAVAICSDEIGMGASQRNTKSIKDIVEFFARLSKSAPLNINLDEGRIEALMTPNPDELISRAQRAVHEAFNQFGGALQGKVPLERVDMIVYGMNYLSEPLVDIFNRAIIKTVPSIPLIRQGGVRGMNFFSRLGEDAELVYGGITHPNFNIPSFVVYR